MKEFENMQQKQSLGLNLKKKLNWEVRKRWEQFNRSFYLSWFYLLSCPKEEMKLWLAAVNTSAQANNQAQRQVKLADDNKVIYFQMMKDAW